MKKKILFMVSISLLLLTAFLGGCNSKQPEEAVPIPEAEENRQLAGLDEFYGMELTKNRDIRELPAEYSAFDAQMDNCFIIGAMVHNDNLYTEFVNDSGDKKTAFIRVGQNTVEGELILNDILYYEPTDSFYLVEDNSRDSFASEENREIRMWEFEHMAEYDYQGRLYWVLYNGEINDAAFETEAVYVIAFIN